MIGIDIIDVNRIAELSKNTRFLTKVFTQYEIEYFKAQGNNPQTLAGFFCAKESFAKALGCGIFAIKLTDVEVFHDNLGRPLLKLYNKAETLLQKRCTNLSISHTSNFAIAVCVLN
ncbi:MAG: holo-ACP synthase [Clostridiales bacterium]|jgi:holo-[acyl-carrier-protein] synthase|nr:holo-ACP synthase [Clostridiales bacterium]